MTADEQAIRTVIDRWLHASAAGDVNAMLALLADDMVFIVPGRPPFGWNDKNRMTRTDSFGTTEVVP